MAGDIKIKDSLALKEVLANSKDQIKRPITDEDIKQAEKFIKKRKFKHVLEDSEKRLSDVEVIALMNLTGILLKNLNKYAKV